MNRLDHLLGRRLLSQVLVLTGTVIVLILTVDFAWQLGDRLNADLPEEWSLAEALALFYLYRLPGLVSAVLPVMVLLAAILCCVPLLQKGEFIALSAAGIPPRSACRSLLALACLAGAVDLVMQDHVLPRTFGPSSSFQEVYAGKHRSRQWQDPGTGVVWWGSVSIADDQVDRIVDGAAADQAGNVLVAEEVWYQDHAWHARAVQVVGPQSDAAPDADTTNISRSYYDSWILPPSWAPAEERGQLAKRLHPRQALTTPELLARGSRPDLAVVAGRWLRLLLPICALLVALPLFVRFANRQQMLGAAIRAGLFGGIPILMLWALGLIARNSGAHPWPIAFGGGALVLLCCWIPWRRWAL